MVATQQTMTTTFDRKLTPSITRHERRGRRSPARTSLTLALGFVVLGFGLFASYQYILFAHSPHPQWVDFAYTSTGLMFVIVGALAWQRRPHNRTGVLIIWCGVLVLVSSSDDLTETDLASVGLISTTVLGAGLIHLLVAYPSGRLPDRQSRICVGVCYFVTYVFTAPDDFLLTPTPTISWLWSADRPDIAATAHNIYRYSGYVLIPWVGFILWRRLRKTSPAQRRSLAPVYAYGCFTLGYLQAALYVAEWLSFDYMTRFILQEILFAGVPLACAYAVLRGFARTSEVDELGELLGAADPERPTVQAAVADALGDPSARLLYWLPDQETFVDGAGHAVDPLQPGRDRIDIEVAGVRVGAIDYDATLIADQQTVRSAGYVVALAVERERLVAHILARDAALRESRARIVAAGDVERRRIAADLHDGLQGQLVSLAMKIGMLAHRPEGAVLRQDLIEVREGLETAINDLRGLVQGVLPATLFERGLVPAVEDLIDRCPLTATLHASTKELHLPPAVESAAYFVAAEALTNAAKHAHASRLHVEIRRAPDGVDLEIADDGIGGAVRRDRRGLNSIADRVEALGGRLRIESPIGRGTQVLAYIPAG